MDACRDRFRDPDLAIRSELRCMERCQFRDGRVSLRFQRWFAGTRRKFLLAMLAKDCVSVDLLVGRSRNRMPGSSLRCGVRFRAQPGGPLELWSHNRPD